MEESRVTFLCNSLLHIVSGRLGYSETSYIYTYTHVCICSAVTEKKLNVDSTVLIMILPISVDVRSIGPCKAKRMDVFVCYHMLKLIEAL